MMIFENWYLWALILVVVIFLLIAAALSRRRRLPSYKPKGPYLLSAGERQFFEVLINAISDDLYVCPKVRLADIITVTMPKTDKSFWRTFNQISQKHVDFLICQQSDFAPVVVVELDGGSHHDPERSKRDQLVDRALAEAEIRIVHVPVVNQYDSAELRQRIFSHNPTTRIDQQ